MRKKKITENKTRSISGKIKEDKTSRNSKIRLICSKDVRIEYGDIVEIKGKTEKTNTFNNFKGVFHYKEYLKREKIYTSVKVENIKLIKSKRSIKKVFKNINKKLKIKLEKNFSEKTTKYLYAIVLGEKNELSQDIKDNFKNSGLSHILAISGMHIGIIVILFEKILDKITKQTMLKKYILIIILIFYSLIIKTSPSSLRSIIMVIIHLISKLLHKKDNFFINISLASIILLISNPYNLINTGFILSFLASFGIVTILKKIPKIKTQNIIIKYILEAVLLSISANILIIPIIIYSFKKFSLSTFLTQILMIPLLYIIELLGLTSLILPSQIMIYKKILEFIVNIFDYLSQIHFFTLYIKVFNLYETLIYYSLIFLILTKKKRVKRYIKKIIIIILILNFSSLFYLYLNQKTEIHILDVGQGDSTLIITENNKKILIDGGGSENYNIGENVLIPYLLGNRINKLDYIIISHFDTDHIRWNIRNYKKHKSKKYNNRKTIRKLE